MEKIVIITTLSIEFEQFQEVLNDKTKILGKQVFEFGQELQKYSSGNFEIFLIKINSPGLVQATLTTNKVVNLLNPQYIILSGTCAGVKNQIGDIIVSSQIIDISNLKIVNDEFLYKSKVYYCSPRLVGMAKAVGKEFKIDKSNSNNYKNLLKNIKVHFGSTISSDKTITSKSQIQPIFNAHRDLLGIEMEGAGCAAAIQDSNSQIEFIQIRCIAETLEIKGDKNVKFASFISAVYTVELVLNGIISDNKTQSQESNVNNEKEKIPKTDFKTGKGTNLKRDFDLSKAYLNSSSYAKVLAEIFATSEGEFCFAIKGNWGRGKTYLMHLTAEELKDSHQIFWFSAWKYRTKPELWAYLFESIREKVNEMNFFKRIPLIFQGKLLQFGYWPIISTILALAISVIPLASVFIYLIGILGIIGSIKLIKLYSKRKDTFSGLSKFLFLSKFSDRLGLQALLGVELRYLLLGLFNKEKPSRIKIITALIFYTISIVILNMCIFWGLSQKNNFDLLKQITNVSLYPNASTLNLIFIIINFLAILLPIWLLLTRNQQKKALLIIDDLDRVSPTEMLDIIESLKLFLENEKINEVLQIAMIFEENAIVAPLISKYSDHILTEDDKERIVNENMQKLFIAHLNLAPLNMTECVEYAKKYLEFEEVNSIKRKEETNRNSIVSKSRNGKDSHTVTVLNSEKEPKQKSDDKKIEILTIDEKKAILEALLIFGESEKSVINLSPRTVQSFTIKYKLGRKLLESRGIYNFSPELFTKILARKITNKYVKVTLPDYLEEDKESINAVLLEIT